MAMLIIYINAAQLMCQLDDHKQACVYVRLAICEANKCGRRDLVPLLFRALNKGRAHR